MQYEKPGGVMHEVIRRAFEEVRLHNNPQTAITIVTRAFANADGLPLLQSGKDLNGNTPWGTPQGALSGGDTVAPRFRDATAGGVGVSSANSRNQNGHDDSATRQRTGGSSSLVRATQAASVQWLVSGDICAVVPPPNSAPSTSTIASLPPGTAELLNKRNYFNRTQILRLLLIRCEAYSITKQHSRALQDALNAVEVSQGQSAEAYFAVGREQHRQFNIVEATSAFDTAEVLLQSMQQAIRAGQSVVDGWIQETVSDEDFWAERGYQMSEVQELGITRREFELQEPPACCNGLSNPDSALFSPLGHHHADLQSHLMSGRGGRGQGPDFEALVAGTASSALKGPISLNGSRANSSFAGDSCADHDTSSAENERSGLMQCGFSANELAMWRRLSNESRALLAMRQLHTVPSVVLGTANTLLDRRVSNYRGGLAISLENNLGGGPLRFVGATAPDGLYLDGFGFPDTIAKAHCGLAMLHPRGWGGYSGCVCYQVHEHLSCFFYFDCPLLGSLRCGVRFIEHSVSDLRRAFAEMNKETGVYGTEGGSTASAVAPLTPHANTSAASGYNCSGPGGSPMIGGATTPLTTTVARMNAARSAIRVPPSGTWMTSHSATSASRRLIKATSRLNGSQGIAFSLSEVLAVRLRSVELAPALEYVGATTLKKLSAVSHRYRELINNLPPPMFYGPGRRPYPDYCVTSDWFSSPWIVRDAQPVMWKLFFDGRLADQEEFSISDEGDSQKRILSFSVDAQTKVTGYVYFGDKRCLLYIIKESWIPFSNTLYLCTPAGRTFASFVATSSQTQFTLSLSSASGGGGNVRGGVAKGGDDVLYSAIKRMSRAGDVATAPARSGVTGAAVTATVAGVVIGDGVSGNHSRGSQLTAALDMPASGPAIGCVDGVNHAGGSSARCIVSSAAQPAASMVGGGSSGLPTGQVSTATVGGVAKATTYTPNSALAPGFGQSSLETTPNGTAAAVSMTTGNPVYYSIWRSQRVSGGAVGDGATPATTNSGADIAAEIKVIPVLYGMVMKGYCAAEITLYTGADAMLVSLMSFLLTRW
ncbi:hypothetical protein JKF63_04584 [Porcisia hertigi]|uniref:Uncharacterized protein n=1 Tax=Porcisia hertigi TaxID=2761500 RepID=A0A836I1D2_9TRYP|nr:hypothetical protein JKF63_04584 [Porcisia hertigi]